MAGIAKRKGIGGYGVRSLLYNKKAAPYLFLLPFILSLLIFNVYPIISSAMMSFQKLTGFSTAKWVGVDNYRKLWNSSFIASLKTTTLVTLFDCVVLVVVPLILALLLNNLKLRGKNAFRAVFFIPSLASTIVAGIIFRMLFSETETAAINSILTSFGLPAQRFMLNYNWSIFLMVFLTMWKSAGLYMIYFLSGMQAIPEQVYESAIMDGANKRQELFHITLPLLKPTIIYILTMLIMEGYRTFGESYVFWKESTPGNIGLTVVRYLYEQAFTSGKLGMGSAIGFALLGIVLIINLVQMKGLGLFKKD